MAEKYNWITTFVVPAVSGLIGIFIGSWLSGRQAKIQRKHAFIEQQLSKFYSPILGLRTEIKIRSELREKIQNIANTAWKELCSNARKEGGPQKLKELMNSRFDEFKSIIEYDNRKFKGELLPNYKEMLKVFRESMWLAEPSTRKYFQKLAEFVDIWERSLDNSMPAEVLEKLDHAEKKLFPFYEHLEQMHSCLRKKLESGEV